MAHDIFISYSSKDKAVADAVCAILEARGVRCWIAPRDVLPGKEWGDALIDAINESRAMVLVFSANANRSGQIKREVNHAVEKGVAIVPLRIEDVTPSDAMEYYLDVTHWLDALTPPIEDHLQALADKVQQLLGETQRDDGRPAAGGPTSTVPLGLMATAGGARGRAPLRSRKLLAGASAAVALALLAGLFLFLNRGRYAAFDAKEFRGSLSDFVENKETKRKEFRQYGVVLQLDRRSDGSLGGRYRYDTKNATDWLPLKGSMTGPQDFTLNADELGEVFKGKFTSENEMKGSWHKGEKKLEFQLKVP
jgi:TIR domain